MVAIVLVLVGANAIAEPPVALTFGEVELEGVLEVRTEYGPPEFEYDGGVSPRVTIPVLRLGRPVCVRPKPEDEDRWPVIPSIDVIQVVDLDHAGVSRLVGRRVRIKGVLEPAETGHHYTEAILLLSKKKDISPVKAEGQR